MIIWTKPRIREGDERNVNMDQAEYRAYRKGKEDGNINTNQAELSGHNTSTSTFKANDKGRANKQNTT